MKICWRSCYHKCTMYHKPIHLLKNNWTQHSMRQLMNHRLTHKWNRKKKINSEKMQGYRLQSHLCINYFVNFMSMKKICRVVDSVDNIDNSQVCLWLWVHILIARMSPRSCIYLGPSHVMEVIIIDIENWNFTVAGFFIWRINPYAQCAFESILITITWAGQPAPTHKNVFV